VTLATPNTAKRLVATALGKFGRVDTLVNNAGIFIGKPFTEYSEEDYRLKLRTNLDGFFFTTQQVIPVMLAQGSMSSRSRRPRRSSLVRSPPLSSPC
jgi:NAD(P)-dependent dehydrogenase (short-subunit alcohol dehydrogenase family)